MKTILETERLLLREMGEDDFAALKKVIFDPENMKYYPKPYDDDGVRRWIAWCKDCYKKYGFGLWAVIEKNSGEMIGDCGLSTQWIDDAWRPEIGYHLRLDKHRQGIGKEMTQAVKDYFFENLPMTKFIPIWPKTTCLLIRRRRRMACIIAISIRRKMATSAAFTP